MSSSRTRDEGEPRRAAVRTWLRRGGVLLALSSLLAACEYIPVIVPPGPTRADEGLYPEEPAPAEPEIEVAASPQPLADDAADTEPQEAPEPVDFYQPGSGVFVAEGATVAVSDAEGAITLNFEGTSLLEVIKVILGDILGENYVIDPLIQGVVTLQTSRALPKEALIPTLEMLLRSNGAALVDQGDLFNIVPRDGAIQGLVSPQLGDAKSPLPKGYKVLVVPLEYIAAREMHKILEPFTVTGNIVRVDIPRNLLILAGSGPELDRLLETVQVFDVDWLAGMSVALFTPQFVDAKTLAQELDKILGDPAEGPLAGLVRLTEIERLNALLVITSREAYLDKVAEWVERLDRASGNVGRRLFVYHVQNGKAVDLAGVLNQVFSSESATVEIPEAELAPGLEPVALESPATQPLVPVPETLEQLIEQQPVPEPETPGLELVDVLQERVSSRAEEGLAVSEDTGIRIIPDEINNALLVMATEDEFRQVQAALRRLDIPPLQVLIETMIAEISLSGDLRYGLEWFFKNGLPDDYTGRGILDLGAAGLNAVAPGFSYAVTDAANVVRVVLNTLASQSRVNVLSSPSVMVLNNQTSTINVGDEVPITTQQQQSTAASSTVVNNIEFRDTGVLLSVTPRVNAGGLVTMEIQQEVSNVAPGTGNTLTPTIQQRKINSTVAVQSGHTVVLGGLIRENKAKTQSGIPVLHTLPLIGPLFGSTTDEVRRVELVVLITPRAVQNTSEAARVTDEYREKMESLKPIE